MFVFISAADPETAAIPERFTPSLEDLTSRSGLSKSTVAEWLTVLEESGWIKRDRPSIAESLGSGRRTRYVLAIGDMEGSPKPQRVRKPTAKTTVSSETVTNPGVRVADSPRGGQSEAVDGPRGGQSGVRVADSDSPRGGHKSSPSHQAHLPPTGAAPDGAAAEALFELDPDTTPVDEEARISALTGELVGAWIQHCAAHKITLNPQIRARFGKAIKELLGAGTETETIQAALIRMRERGKASRPAMLHEFVVDVQNPAASRATPALAVSSSSDFKKWQKGTSS